MKFAFSTDIGKRNVNEDSLYVPLEEGAKPLFIVADGMGGHKGGLTASRLAAFSVAEYVQQNTNDDMQTMARVASAYANAKVFSRAESQKGLQGMGTTLAFVYFDGDSYVAANVGDSRIYHYNGVSLHQVTHDHSYVAALLLAGEITPEEAENHPNRNVITRAIGISPIEQADIFENTWELGDIILLCTDGLSSGVSNKDIKEVLKNITNLDAACRHLTVLAREGGATDNVTIILIKNDSESEAALND